MSKGTVVSYQPVRQAHRAGGDGKIEGNVTVKAYMYILKCANGSYYTGSTTDLEMRVEEHKNGLGANFTRKHLPVKLVYVEEFSKIEDAFSREKQIQGWTRKKKEALISGNFDKLKEFAKTGSTGSPSGGE